MTPDEQIAAVATLQAQMEETKRWRLATDAHLEAMNKKLDELIAIANRGKGAWRIILILGGGISAMAGIAAWVFDHLPKGQ